MFNWLIFSSFVLSASFTLLGLLVDLSYQIKIAPAIDQLQSQQQRNLEAYLESKSLYLSHPVFNPPTQKGENFSLLWQRLISENPNGRLVDKTFKQEHLSMGAEWLEHKHKIKLPKNLKDLFNKVENYAYWKPLEPLKGFVPTDIIVSSQLFLAYTYYYQPTALRQALERVRHFSKILLKMEDLNFKRAGLSLLNKEREFIEFLSSRRLKTQWIWTPLSSQELFEFRKYLAETGYYLNYLTSQPILKKIFLEEEPPVGFCALLKEKNQFLTWSNKFLHGQFPFEPSFGPALKTMEQIFHKGQQSCQQKHQSIHSAHGDFIAKIPYYRRLYGIKILLEMDPSRQLL